MIIPNVGQFKNIKYMKTTITLFVEPKSLTIFLEVLKILENLPINNSYHFRPSDLVFTEEMISNWCWINVPIDQYIKLKYCIQKQSNQT